MKQLAKKTKLAAKKLNALTNDQRKNILNKMASILLENADKIAAENEKDLQYAKENDLSLAMVDRLKLDVPRIKQMVEGVHSVMNQPEVVGTYFDEKINEEGLTIKKQRIPLGVILMIFESRPNVVVDCAALAIKSANAIILKGGKEAKHTNEILGNLIRESIAEFVDQECVQVLASDKREHVNELLELEQYIDVVIPRGGQRLIEYVHQNAKMPVIAHFQGLCHMYIDAKADAKMAVELALNAKTQRTGVCNAIETLLIHEDILEKIGSDLVQSLQEKNCELRADEKFCKMVNADIRKATPEDWSTEYLDNILSIKVVPNLQKAIEHINEYGTFHTECIVSQDEKALETFCSQVDASCIVQNASSRFNDGGQLGLGAELGISTTKIHAYGPMGAQQMTTARYVVVGNGQIRK